MTKYSSVEEMVAGIGVSESFRKRLSKRLAKIGDDIAEEMRIATQWLGCIPRHQREQADKQMRLAAILGWRHIGFWEGWENDGDSFVPLPASIADMCGVNPDTGFVELITAEKIGLNLTDS